MIAIPQEFLVLTEKKYIRLENNEQQFNSLIGLEALQGVEHIEIQSYTDQFYIQNLESQRDSLISFVLENQFDEQIIQVDVSLFTQHIFSKLRRLTLFAIQIDSYTFLNGLSNLYDIELQNIYCKQNNLPECLGYLKQLHDISINYCDNVYFSNLICLHELHELENITIEGSNIIESLQGIQQLKNIKSLNIFEDFLNVDVTDIFKANKLKYVSIYVTNITISEVTIQNACLSNLKICDNTYGNILNDQANDQPNLYMNKLVNLKSLKQLEISNWSLLHQDSIAQLSLLTSLTLCHIQQINMSVIVKLLLLQKLVLKSVANIENFNQIAQLLELKHLEMSNCQLSNENLQYISQIKNLQSLTINFHQIGLQLFKDFSDAQNLKKICIINENISCLKGLEAIEHLEELKVNYYQIPLTHDLPDNHSLKSPLFNDLYMLSSLITQRKTKFSVQEYTLVLNEQLQSTTEIVNQKQTILNRQISNLHNIIRNINIIGSE
ncbi:tandem-95_repeat protein [Hexamita inflata]|uniref:Tandem-95 repeat protein n=1 Tax=Hexamita inflata TaxID=28002 RepID=A0AA86QSX9_9EUKA|nr:tandem-95 repeat protein [Hexamita inflata]